MRTLMSIILLYGIAVNECLTIIKVILLYNRYFVSRNNDFIAKLVLWKSLSMFTNFINAEFVMKGFIIRIKDNLCDCICQITACEAIKHIEQNHSYGNIHNGFKGILIFLIMLFAHVGKCAQIPISRNYHFTTDVS